ncbi:MAG: methyltransferase domain-containing protein [Pseudomonadota bacterium]
MFSVFLPPDYAEADVKPSELLERYRALLAVDVESTLKLVATATLKSCPACGSTDFAPAFERYGLKYQACSRCGSLFVSPRPPADAIAAFYRDAESEQFWRSDLADGAVAERQRRIFGPRLEWLDDAAIGYLDTRNTVIDVGTREPAFATAFARYERFARRVVVDDVLPADWTSDDLERAALAALPDGSFDAATVFETLDRAADVDGLMEGIRRILKPGGLLLATGILASGFDIQTLWDKAAALTPPDRLNVFTVEGWRHLADRHGFEVLELSTPGMFDVAAIAEAARHGLVEPPRAIAYLLNARDDDARVRFQEFLQSALMSSFGRLALRRRVD